MPDPMNGHRPLFDLEKLKQLRAAGAISDDEYAGARLWLDRQAQEPESEHPQTESASGDGDAPGIVPPLPDRDQAVDPDEEGGAPPHPHAGHDQGFDPPPPPAPAASPGKWLWGLGIVFAACAAAALGLWYAQGWVKPGQTIDRGDTAQSPSPRSPVRADQPVPPSPGGAPVSPDSPDPRQWAAARQRGVALETVFGSPVGGVLDVMGQPYRYQDGQMLWAGSGPMLIAEGRGPTDTAIGVFYLAARPGGFARRGTWPRTLILGSSGDRWRVSWAFGRDPVLLVERQATPLCRTLTLVSLKPSGPVAQARVPIRQADPAGPSPVNGEITDIRKDRGFAVRYDDGLPPERYVLTGHRYQLVDPNRSWSCEQDQ